MTKVRNNTHAVIDGLQTLLSEGMTTQSRLGTTKEILNYNITITRPLERLVQLPQIDTNIAAQIIDGWWILSGSNDIEILDTYLPEAHKRSDDDVTWRGGFGPRLRNWHGIDQLKEIIKLIHKRPESRRASLAVFDPIYDFHESKDVSTTNTIHFIVRNQKLHMSVDMRSADILGHEVPGGLFANNLYEWSLLLEAMAHWTGYSVGTLHLYIRSLHLYENDYDLARSITHDFSGTSVYEEKPIKHFSFQTPYYELDTKLDMFFASEKLLATYTHDELPSIGDNLLDATLLYLWHKHHPEEPLTPRLMLSDLGSFVPSHVPQHT
jgi:thymidylate synthase